LRLSGSGFDQQHVALYRRIGYDPDLERLAFERLAQNDLTGSRSLFFKLAAHLELNEEGQRAVGQLLLETLQTVNRRIHPEGGAIYQGNRMALLAQFDDCPDAQTARQRFARAINQLLSPVPSERLSSHPMVRRARRHIEEHYSSRIALASIAELLNVSPNYLSRLFRQETGLTLTAYVQKVRLEHARRLLGEGRQSISEIAYRVGYQTYRDFYRNFVKYEQSSPRQMRRRLAGGRGTQKD